MRGNKRMIAGLGVLITVAFLAAGGSMVYAHSRGHGGHDRCWSPEKRAERITQRLSERLNLDDAQKQELAALVKDIGEKRKEMWEQRAKTKDELVVILRSNEMDRSKVDQLIQDRKQKMDDMITTVGQQITDFAFKLSPEQRIKLADAIEDHALFFGGRFHH